MSEEKDDLSEEEKEKVKSRALEIIGMAISATNNSDRAGIVKHIKQHGKVSFEELKKEFGFSETTMIFHLQKLQDAYIVSQSEDGSYEIGELGDVVLELLDVIGNSAESIIEKLPLK